MKILSINQINNSSNSYNRNNVNPSFKANLQLHKEVMAEIIGRATFANKDPYKASDSLKAIWQSAASKVKPLKPDVNVIIGSTRRGDNTYMVYSQVPGAPYCIVQTKDIGSIDVEQPSYMVDKIVNAPKTLLWGIRTLM